MASPQAVLPETRSEEKLSSPTAAQPTTERELRFSLGQMIVMWSIIVGSMIAVFLFGLFTGREQGMKRALETQEQFAQRLPINREGSGNDTLASSRAQEIAIPSPVVTPPTAPQTVGQAVGQALSTTTPPPAALSPEVPTDTAPSGPVISGPALATLDTAAPKSAAKEAVAKVENKGKLETKTEDVGASGSVTTLASLANKIEKTPAAIQPPAQQEPTSPSAAVESTKRYSPKATANQPSASESANGGLTKGVLSKGWYVQVAAAKSQSEVEGYVAKLKKLGMKVQLEIATVRNVKYFRVMAGPFKNQAAAVGAQKKIKDSKVSLSTPFTKQVS